MEKVCRNLRTPYFDISLNKSNVASCRGCQLPIPASFIKQHGDKIQEHVTLQAEAARGQVWDVKLWVSTNYGKVLITTGWKAFASSNELEQGDRLLFSLKAMSQFVVYIFDEAGTQKVPRCSPAASYKPCNNQDCKAWHDLEKSEKFRNKESEEATSCDRQVFFDKRRIVSRLSCHAEQPASTHLPKTGPVEGGRDERVISCGSKALQQLSKVQTKSYQKSGRVTTGSGFLKTLTIAHMQGSSGNPSAARLELPWDFVRLHGHQLREVIKLRGPYKVGQVVAVSYWQSARCPRAYFKGISWRQFLDQNSLKEGDELLFTLVATSCFAVKRLWK